MCWNLEFSDKFCHEVFIASVGPETMHLAFKGVDLDNRIADDFSVFQGLLTRADFIDSTSEHCDRYLVDRLDWH